MPLLVKMYIRQVIIGFGIAGIFVAMLLYLDVKGLWGLVSNSPDGVLVVGLLWFFNGIVFGGIQFAIWVMGQADPSGPSTGKRVRLVPARVKSEAKAPRK